METSRLNPTSIILRVTLTVAPRRGPSSGAPRNYSARVQAIGRVGRPSQRRGCARPRWIAFNFSTNLSAARESRRKIGGKRRRVTGMPGTGGSPRAATRPRFLRTSVTSEGNAAVRPRRAAARRGAARPPVAAPRGFFLDPRARFYSAHGKQFCPIINRAIVGGWLYARGAFHTSECNGNQIERRRARGPSAGVNTR